MYFLTKENKYKRMVLFIKKALSFNRIKLWSKLKELISFRDTFLLLHLLTRSHLSTSQWPPTRCSHIPLLRFGPDSAFLRDMVLKHQPKSLNHISGLMSLRSEFICALYIPTSLQMGVGGLKTNKVKIKYACHGIFFF